jgi:hypothetical protein
MSRFARKVDANQTQIVAALRAAGVVVEPRLARVGGGVPDLLCGYGGRTVLLEVKDGAKPKHERRLTADEQEWALAWAGAGGPLLVVESPEEAVFAVTGRRMR